MPAAGRAEEAGDLGDGFAAGFDVAHGGAGVLVPGLGHDELERDFGVAEESMATNNRPLPRNTVAKKRLAPADPVSEHPDEPQEGDAGERDEVQRDRPWSG